MAIFKYEELSHVDLAGLNRMNTLVLIPTGPLEEHGPHLPLGVDPMIARYFSEKLAERLAISKPQHDVLILPTIFAGSDTLIFRGSIEVRPWVFHHLLYDCCKQLAKDGFKNFIAIGTHGGPRHMVVLEEVASKMRWRYRVNMISASGKIILGMLSGGFREKIIQQLDVQKYSLSNDQLQALKTDYHAGMIETSLMQVIRPDLVKPIYRELSAVIIPKYWQIRRSSISASIQKGQSDHLVGYLGSPSYAHPEIGKAVVEVLLNELEPLIDRFLQGENVSQHFRSWLYYVPFFRTHFLSFVLLLLFAGLFALALFYLNYFAMELIK